MSKFGFDLCNRSPSIEEERNLLNKSGSNDEAPVEIVAKPRAILIIFSFD
ncbi:MAG: hypothetical protein OEM02_05620 [Desulfobulbaceae bacterium]|nr:hypothetical protein [Desulfobulbaceae bacterium]